MKLFKSKAGFTLIELLVVIGILAVLAAIAIPSVAGLIDRANKSADQTNANEMTNAVERFVAEYEMYCQDIQQGAVDVNDLTAAQSRVYNVLGTTQWEDIKKIENNGKNSIVIDPDTKYPMSKETITKIVENYTKTSSATFEPKQSDMNYYFCVQSGRIVVAEATTTFNELNSRLINGTDGNGNILTYETTWINLASGLDTIYCKTMAKTKENNTKIVFYTFFPEAKFDWDTNVLTIYKGGEPIEIKSAKLIRSKLSNIPYGEELSLETPNVGTTVYALGDSVTNGREDGFVNQGGMQFTSSYNLLETSKDPISAVRMVFTTTDGKIIYGQTYFIRPADILQ